MASTRDIRRRIKSVKNTAQITKAMQMVAASKMRRAQQAALASRPYAKLLHRVLVSLGDRTDGEGHPLLQKREQVAKELVILVTPDKGLCGPLVTNLTREVAKLEPGQAAFVSVGRKGAQFLARGRRELLADFPLSDAPTFAESKAVSNFCIEQFLEGAVDRVRVAYTHYINTLTQQPAWTTVLPISQLEVPAAEAAPQAAEPTLDYLFEPGPEKVLGAILPYFVHFQVFQTILDARASEHSARMVAMKNATDNAKQLVADLTLEYNKVRQASITNELLEIATAQMALG